MVGWSMSLKLRIWQLRAANSFAELSRSQPIVNFCTMEEAALT